MIWGFVLFYAGSHYVALARSKKTRLGLELRGLPVSSSVTTLGFVLLLCFVLFCFLWVMGILGFLPRHLYKCLSVYIKRLIFLPFPQVMVESRNSWLFSWESCAEAQWLRSLASYITCSSTLLLRSLALSAGLSAAFVRGNTVLCTASKHLD